MRKKRHVKLIRTCGKNLGMDIQVLIIACSKLKTLRLLFSSSPNAHDPGRRREVRPPQQIPFSQTFTMFTKASPFQPLAEDNTIAAGQSTTRFAPIGAADLAGSTVEPLPPDPEQALAYWKCRNEKAEPGARAVQSDAYNWNDETTYKAYKRQITTESFTINALPNAPGFDH